MRPVTTGANRRAVGGYWSRKIHDFSGVLCKLCEYRSDRRVFMGPVEPGAGQQPDRAPVQPGMKPAAEVKFAMDSPLEGDGFEPSVPRQKDNAFRDSAFPTCARATAAFENARRQQLLLPVLDPVQMSAELTRQLGDRPVPPTAAATSPSL
jgi:hypothetical protein